MSALVVFAATFVTVFALGLQSRIVNRGQYIAAGFTSLVIATGSLHLYEILARPTGLDRVGYYVGGVIGITLSIWFHKRAEAWISLRVARWKARAAVGYWDWSFRRIFERKYRRPDEHRDVSLAGGVLTQAAAAKCPRCGCGPEVPVCKIDPLCPRLQKDVH